MKTLRHIMYTGIVISLVTVFSVSGVSAYGKSSEYESGKQAGMAQVKSDSRFTHCSWLKSADETKKSAKMERRAIGEKLAMEGRSDDYIDGFKSGYEMTKRLYSDIQCSR